MIRWTPTVKMLHSLTGLSCTSWPGPIPIHLVSKIFQFVRQLDAGASKDGHARGKWPFCKGSFTYPNNTLHFFLLLLKMTEGVHLTTRPKQHQPCCQEKEGSQVLTKKMNSCQKWQKNKGRHQMINSFQILQKNIHTSSS